MKEDDFKSGDRRDGGRPTNGRRDDARNGANPTPRPRTDETRRDDRSGGSAPRNFGADTRRFDSDRPRRDDSAGARPVNRESNPDRRSDDRPRPSFNRESNNDRPRPSFNRNAGNSASRPERSGTSRFGNSQSGERREEYPKPKFNKDSNARWEKRGSNDRPQYNDRPAPRFDRDADRRDAAPRDAAPRDTESTYDQPRRATPDTDEPRAERIREERPRTSDDSRQRSGENRFGQERRYEERPKPSRDADSRDSRPVNRDADRRDAAPRDERDSSPRPTRPYDNTRSNDRDDRSRNNDRPRSFDRDDRRDTPSPARRFDNPSNERSSDRNAGSDRPKPYGQSRAGQTGNDRPRPDRNAGPRADVPGRERPGHDRPGRDDRRSGPSSEDRRVGKYDRAPHYDMDAMRNNIPRKKREELDRIEKHDNRNTEPGTIRLNRYIANAGICSRREADELIAQGTVQVNGKVVTEMGHKVQQGDVVKYGNRILNPEKMVYVLLNKPKDYITTTEDPEERRTVMELVADAGPFRIYPVGRLDRNTTGLMLMTNDGELAEKLTHPSNEIRKIYQVELDKPISDEHFESIQAGVELEDGLIKPDAISIVTPDAQVVGVEIHSGRNRIVRRIFENFGYEVTKLDRTSYAGLSKKDLPRGKWRFLEPREVIKLKYLQ